MWIYRLLTACTVFLSAVAGDASAHHAFSANYDLEDIGTVEGVVEEVFWANPHVHYYVRVTDADGAKALWDVESMNLNSMTRAGWTKSTVGVGDAIKVTGPLGRRGARRIDMDQVVRVDGEPLPKAP